MSEAIKITCKFIQERTGDITYIIETPDTTRIIGGAPTLEKCLDEVQMFIEGEFAELQTNE